MKIKLCNCKGNEKGGGVINLYRNFALKMQVMISIFFLMHLKFLSCDIALIFRKLKVFKNKV